MVEQGSESRFEDLTNGLARVDSQFLKTQDLSMEAMNAEIVQLRIRNEEECKKWWENSFAGYQERKQQQQQQGGGGESNNNSSSYKLFLEELIKLKCVMDNDNVSLQSTVTGKIACTYRLKINTVSLFADFIQEEKEKDDISTTCVNEKLRTILTKICFAKEFESLTIRRDQKTQLNNIAWSLGRFKFSKSNYRVKSFSDKTFQLVQGVLNNVTFADTMLRQEVHFVMERIPRMTRALLKMMIDSKNLAAIFCALLVRTLQTKSWEDDIFNQLDGVGAKTLERLKELNVLNSLDQILAKPGQTSGLLAPKAIAHVKSIVSQRKTCLVYLDGTNALIVKLVEGNHGMEKKQEESGNGKKKNDQENGYWLGVVAKNGLIGWSDSGCLAIPINGNEVKHFEVWGIHKKLIGIDFRFNYSFNSGGGLKLMNNFNENYQVWKTSPFSYLSSSTSLFHKSEEVSLFVNNKEEEEEKITTSSHFNSKNNNNKNVSSSSLNNPNVWVKPKKPSSTLVNSNVDYTSNIQVRSSNYAFDAVPTFEVSAGMEKKQPPPPVFYVNNENNNNSTSAGFTGEENDESENENWSSKIAFL